MNAQNLLLILASIVGTSFAQLKAHGNRLGLQIGAASNGWGDGAQFAIPAYAYRLNTEYNVQVAENECKMTNIRPNQATYDFSDCDRAYNLSRNAGADFRFHAAIWYNDLPTWFTALNAANQRSAIISHITTVMNYYKGKIDVYDIVNEALADAWDSNGGVMWRQEPLYQNNPDFVELSLRTARAVNPSARLFYNDYSNHFSYWGQSRNQLNLIDYLQSRDVPLDGVGFQCHVDVAQPITKQTVIDAFAPYVARGLEVQITELDVACPATCNLNRQAEVYLAFLQACVETPRCTSFVMWGVTDAITWLPTLQPNIFSGTIVNGNYTEKPAYTAMLNYLAGLQSIPARQYNTHAPGAVTNTATSTTSGTVTNSATSTTTATVTNSATGTRKKVQKRSVRKG
ncbi:hypothetical protein MP228_008859 [Amoeboaphelidium protococcarum]|nr:hypothetical protein MP228_008859 [Amoeboaphelidium protococcarum]